MLQQLTGHGLFILCKDFCKHHYKESLLEFSSLDILDDEYPVLAGPNNNSRQKSGPHIELPFFPTLSNSCIVSYKNNSYKREHCQTHWILYLIINVKPKESK